MKIIKKLIIASSIATFGIIGALALAQTNETPVATESPAPVVSLLPTPSPAASFQDALTKFRGIKEQFLQTRENLKNARQDQRAALTIMLLEKRKNLLTRAIDVLIKKSEGVKKRVVKNKAIYGDLESSIIAEIDADIAKLNELKTRAAQAQTTEELKNLVQEIKTYRHDVRQTKIKRLLLLSYIGRFEKAVLNNAEARSARIAAKLTELKSAGKDVSAWEALLEQANTKIASAKSQLAQLKTEVNQQELGETKIAEIRTKLNEIKNQIKAVYDIFRQIATQGRSFASPTPSASPSPAVSPSPTAEASPTPTAEASPTP